MLTAGSSAQTVAFDYDALGRTLYQYGPLGTAWYQYDLAGRRTQMTWPGSGLAIGYAYNAAGDLTEIRENPDGSNALLATYAYDDLGRRVSLTRGNGTVTSYGYDPVSRLDELVQDFAGTSGDLTLAFTHNPAGQIATGTRSNDQFSFTGLANASVTDTHNGLNQLTATGSTSIGHGDGRGNITAIGSNVYGYSSENMLISAPGSVSLTYDPLNRLYQTAGAATTRFAYDGTTIIAEYDGSNALLRRYVHAPGALAEPLVWYEGSGTSDRRFLHADERGSIIAVSNSAGTVTSVNSYDEYGMPASGNVGRFQYTGQPWLPEIALYYLRNRMYNPVLPRFMQADPIGYGDGMNPYLYGGADPVNLTDPSGLARKSSDAPSGSGITCTGTRLGCGGGGLGYGFTGFSSGAVGGQIPTGAGLLNDLGFSTAGLTNGQIRDLGAKILGFAEMLSSVSLTPRQGLNDGCYFLYTCGGSLTRDTLGLLNALLADDDVYDSISRSWALSLTHGPTRHEHGFWISRNDTDYIAHAMIEGSAYTINPGIAPRDADIFFHTHPDPLGRQSLSIEDGLWALRRRVAIIAFSGQLFFIQDGR